MPHEILINVTPQETRVAMLEQGVVQEFHIERSSARGLVGNICLGRVARVLPGMQSAFVEIGLERAASAASFGLPKIASSSTTSVSAPSTGRGGSPRWSIRCQPIVAFVRAMRST